MERRLRMSDGTTLCQYGKRCFTKQQARWGAAELSNRHGRPTFFYKCPICRMYHVTRDGDQSTSRAAEARGRDRKDGF